MNTNIKLKLKEQTYIVSGDKYAGYVAFSFPEERMDEFEDYSVIQVYDLEVEYRNSQNLPYRCGKTDKKGYTNEYLGRISYFYTWNEGIVQIGFITHQEEEAIQRCQELKKMLEFGGFQICPDEVTIIKEHIT